MKWFIGTLTFTIYCCKGSTTCNINNVILIVTLESLFMNV